MPDTEDVVSVVLSSEVENPSEEESAMSGVEVFTLMHAVRR